MDDLFEAMFGGGGGKGSSFSFSMNMDDGDGFDEFMDILGGNDERSFKKMFQ